MALINRAGQEISAKVVYYGPGLSGKTTNLEVLFRQVPEDSRGKMISMKTRTDRTLFFDLLPLSADPIRDFQVRILLYTVPGQVYYNATRRLVLKGVDAVVFVADSQRGKMEENLESLENLRSNLADMSLKLDELPWVIQYNKRDLPDVLSIDELNQALNPTGVPSFEAVAPRGEGVQETLAGVSNHLRPHLERMVLQEAGDQSGMPKSVEEALDITDMGTPPSPEQSAPGQVHAPAPEPPALEISMPPSGRSGLDLDLLPDPPVVEMPAPGEAPAPRENSGLDSLMGSESVRTSLRELESTVQASPLRNLGETHGEKPKSKTPPPTTVSAPPAVEQAPPATPPRAESEAPARPFSASTPTPPAAPAQPEAMAPPATPQASPPSRDGAPVLEVSVPRHLLEGGELILRLKVEAGQSSGRPADESPAPSPGKRLALRDGELVPVD